MKTERIQPNNCVSFGAKEFSADTLRNIKKITNCGLDGLEARLLDQVKKVRPDLVKTIGGIEYVPQDKTLARLVDCFKDLAGIPLDLAVWASQKITPLQYVPSVAKHKKAMEFDNTLKALQGLYNSGYIILKNEKFNEPLPAECDELCRRICDINKDKFNGLLNGAMDFHKSVYDTKKERLSTRLVSGLTAAAYLGADYYNKPILKGKSEEDAKHAQHKKQSQEIWENLYEGLFTFVISACFSKLINTSVWASAVVGTAVSLVARIISRLTKGMPLTRVKVPDVIKHSKNDFYTMDKFIESLNNKDKKFEKTVFEKPEEKPKRHILTLKHIGLFCATSIGIGFALRYGRNKFHPGPSEKSAKLISNHTRQVLASKDEISQIADALQKAGEKKLALQVSDLLSSKDESIMLGYTNRTKKIFNLIEVETAELHRARSGVPRFFKELVTYPYKLASKFYDGSMDTLKHGIKKGKIKGMPARAIEKVDKAFAPAPEVYNRANDDYYNIKNIYLRFRQFKEKQTGTDAKLVDDFAEYIKTMRLASLDDLKTSKIDNAQIAVIAQTLGTLTGMGFNMTDEFNASIKSGSTKEEAEKDARLRGINKFFRMCVQVVVSGSLNGIFGRQYSDSLLKSSAIVGATTIATDTLARFLSGMPIRKMSKKELENYQERRKNGLLRGYYKFIDFMAS